MYWNFRRVLLLSVLSMILPSVAQAQLQSYNPAQKTKTMQTGVYMFNGAKEKFGDPMGFIALQQIGQSVLVHFDLGDMLKPVYRVDIYQYSNCDAVPPYGEKQWSTAIGDRWELPTSEIIKPGDPLAILKPANFGLIRANIMFPNLNLDDMYNKSLIVREGEGIKGKIIACGEIFPDRPIPTKVKTTGQAIE